MDPGPAGRIIAKKLGSTLRSAPRTCPANCWISFGAQFKRGRPGNPAYASLQGKVITDLPTTGAKDQRSLSQGSARWRCALARPTWSFRFHPPEFGSLPPQIEWGQSPPSARGMRNRCVNESGGEPPCVSCGSSRLFDQGLRLGAGEDQHELPGERTRIRRACRLRPVAQPAPQSFLVATNDCLCGVGGIRKLGGGVGERAATEVSGTEDRFELREEGVELRAGVVEVLFDRRREHPVDRQIERVVGGDDEPVLRAEPLVQRPLRHSRGATELGNAARCDATGMKTLGGDRGDPGCFGVHRAMVPIGFRLLYSL